jgi:hypothetical protein
MGSGDGGAQFLAYDADVLDLRCLMATRTRAVLGKEGAKVLLGHTQTTTTDIYLLEEVQEAVKAAAHFAVGVAPFRA